MSTMQNCDRALLRLNEYIASLKSQKVFKDVQFYLSNQETQRQNETANTSTECTGQVESRQELKENEKKHDEQEATAKLEINKTKKKKKDKPSVAPKKIASKRNSSIDKASGESKGTWKPLANLWFKIEFFTSKRMARSV